MRIPWHNAREARSANLPAEMSGVLPGTSVRRRELRRFRVSYLPGEQAGRHSAFSLVEVLCAILILGVGLAGLVQGITTALGSSKEAELQTAAALFAAGQIEVIRADGFVIEGESDGSCGPELEAYQWRQNVTRTPIDGLFEIAVVVEHARSGRAIYELRTLMFDSTSLPASDTTATQDSTRERERNRP